MYIPTSVHSPLKLSLNPCTTSGSRPFAEPTTCSHAKPLSSVAKTSSNLSAEAPH